MLPIISYNDLAEPYLTVFYYATISQLTDPTRNNSTQLSTNDKASGYKNQFHQPTHLLAGTLTNWQNASAGLDF